MRYVSAGGHALDLAVSVGMMLMSAGGGMMDIILVTGLVMGLFWFLVHDDTCNISEEHSGDNNAADGVNSRHELGRTVDDVVYKEGQFVENENSEDWEDFEYENDKKYIS